MERHVADIPHMYSEMMILMKMQGKEENSRHGTVLTLQEPLTVTVSHPTRRVLYDPVRNANPFFHVMEFVWMMAGSNTPEWISQFNSRFVEYADTNNSLRRDIIHGAYGFRWRRCFRIDQIRTAVRMLQENPESRRVVLQMWSANNDLGTEHNDLPCNTHIYLRICQGKLDMTVCNRSNDVIWGMTGANAVHMTFLQELMASELRIPVGLYRVFTNNAHVYKDLPNVEEMLETRNPWYSFGTPMPYQPLLQPEETMEDFLQECVKFIDDKSNLNNHWLKTVAMPIRDIYLGRKDDLTLDYTDACTDIEDLNWRSACIEWLQRKVKPVTMDT